MIKQGLWTLFSTIGYYGRFHKVAKNSSDVILMYHSVGRPNRYGNVSTHRLENDIRYLEQNLDIVDLPEILTESDRKRVAITFDDGFNDFYEKALPILQDRGTPATVFLVSKYINSGSMMSEKQVRDLVENHDYVTIGNHTKTHPKLSRIGDKRELERQIKGAKTDLEEMFDIQVNRFSYPSGDFNHEAVEIVSETHDIGVSTVPRTARQDFLEAHGLDRYCLPRIPAHYPKARVRWEMTDFSSSIREKLMEAGVSTR